MKNRSHYRILTDVDNNFFSNEYYLVINCAGHSFYADGVKASSIRHDYYLIYIVKGSIRVNKPLPDKILNPGDMIIFQPESIFDYNTPEGANALEYYWIHFTGYGASELMKQCGLKTNAVFSPGIQDVIPDFFNKIFDIFLHRENLFHLDSSYNLYGLLLQFSKLSHSYIDSENTNGMKPIVLHNKKPRISRALTYIHNNVSENISLKELCDIENISESHFRSVFKNITGLSPIDYIIMTKLNYACQMINHTDMNINEISASLGYSEPQYFCRVFKKHIGMTPSQFKNGVYK